MSKFLSLIKIMLLLTAFVSGSSSYAARSDGQDLLSIPTSDICFNTAHSVLVDDDKAITSESRLIFASLPHASIDVLYVSVPAEGAVYSPLARAPPSNL